MSVSTDLGTITFIKTGKLDANAQEKDGKYPFFTCGEENLKINDAAFDTEAVLLAGNGNFSVKYYKGKFNAYQRTYVIEPNLVDGKWLYYLVSHHIAKITSSARGSTIKYLRLGDITDCTINLLSLNHQRRVALKVEELLSELDNGREVIEIAREQLKVFRHTILNQAFEGKLTAKWREENANKLESADKLRELINQKRQEQYNQKLLDWELATQQWKINGAEGRKPSKPQKIKELPVISEHELSGLPNLPIGWKYFRLAQVADISSGMSVSKNRKLKEPIEVPYLRVANVQRGELQLEEVKTMLIEKQGLNELKLRKWDVLFNEGGDRDKLGRGWIWGNQIEPCITQNHVFRASPLLATEYHSKFISHWGNTFGREYFEKGGKQTTNLASINKTVLGLFPVPMPSMQEQQEIISVLEDKMSVIESLENEVKNALMKSEVMRQSILKKAFSGELVPQDPNDEPASTLLEKIKAEQEALKNKKTKGRH